MGILSSNISKTVLELNGFHLRENGGDEIEPNNYPARESSEMGLEFLKAKFALSR
jgi:hypothetical protein